MHLMLVYKRTQQRRRRQSLNPTQHGQQTGARTWHEAGAPGLATPMVPGAHRGGEDTPSPLGSHSSGVLGPDELLLGCLASWLAKGIIWHSWKAANPSMWLRALSE